MIIGTYLSKKLEDKKQEEKSLRENKIRNDLSKTCIELNHLKCIY